MMKKRLKIAEKRYCTKSVGVKYDHFKLGVRTRVRAHINLDVRGACVRPKKRSQLTPWKSSYKLINNSALQTQGWL